MYVCKDSVITGQHEIRDRLVALVGRRELATARESCGCGVWNAWCETEQMAYNIMTAAEGHSIA